MSTESDDERSAIVFELTRAVFAELADGFVRVDAQANEGLSAMTYYLAEAAVHHGVDVGAFLTGCEAAFEDALERSRQPADKAS